MSAPFGVITTTDHNQAMDFIERENIKVVLSDHRMPNIKGTEFLQMVKEKFPETVRILFTGYAEFSAAEDAINRAGVYRFVSKPWDSKELKMIVEQAIEHYDLVKQNKELFESTQAKNQELEVLNQRLQMMYDKQKEFTSTVSHELRTPLASIKSTVDLVLSEAPGTLNDDQKKFLTKSKNNVDRLNRLINDILDLSKMEAGKIDFHMEVSDIAQLIQDVIEVHEPVARNKGLYVKGEISSDIPGVHVDTDKIHQVFNNLVGNAMKFTDKGGVTIFCRYQADTDCIEIRIEDSGPGIQEEDLNKLFQKFQQLGDPTKHAGGTGLGLAICKEIVTQHGGEIWVESEYGTGSCFNFTLPVQKRGDANL